MSVGDPVTASKRQDRYGYVYMYIFCPGYIYMLAFMDKLWPLPLHLGLPILTIIMFYLARKFTLLHQWAGFVV